MMVPLLSPVSLWCLRRLLLSSFSQWRWLQQRHAVLEQLAQRALLQRQQHIAAAVLHVSSCCLYT